MPAAPSSLDLIDSHPDSALAGLRPGVTALCAGLSALVWTTLLTYAGYEVGANWETILPWLRRYGQVITAVVLVVTLVLVGRWWWRRRYGPAERSEGAQRNREDPAG